MISWRVWSVCSLLHLSYVVSLPQIVHQSATITALSPGTTFRANPSRIQKGYVAFGDSYAAGIGTGTTSGDACRQGQYSYPKQLAAMADGDIDFQNYPCSGAVVGDVLQGGEKSQIDKWTNVGNADVATLSIGGNDIGFYDILTACVLRVGQEFSGDCAEQVRLAREKINGRELFSDISTALRQIIDKSGRDDLKVYMTGYPTFFNVDTDTCEYSTFYYWQPGHHGIHHIGNWAYLYKDLRRKLNDLVNELNRMLSQVSDAVNQGSPDPRVRFVDINPKFDGHRFCEKDAGQEVTKPDKNRMDTWLFLSGWPDNGVPGSESAAESLNEEHDAIVKGNSTAIPYANDCPNNLGKSTDWADRMLCDTARAVAGNQKDGPPQVGGSPSGGLDENNPDAAPPQSVDIFKSDLYSLDTKDYDALDVPWWVATRQAKTFHPRSLGQQAYKVAIMEAWQ